MSRPRRAAPSRLADVLDPHRLVPAVALLVVALMTGAPRVARAAFAPVFRAPEVCDVGGQPLCVAAGDLNGDGLPDLVVGGETPGSIAILLHWDTQFAPYLYRPAVFKTWGGTQAVVAVRLADINKDGNLDAVVGLAGPSSSAVGVLLGDGVGNFGAPTIYAVGTIVVDVQVGDVNGDSWLDVTTSDGSIDVAVLLGAGDGTLGAPSYYDIVQLPFHQVGLFDATGDGLADIVTESEMFGFIIYPGNPGGTFNSSLPYIPTGLDPNNDVVYGFEAGDLNGDSVVDLIYTWVFDNGQPDAAQHIGVILGTGGGGFQAPANYASSGGPVGPSPVLVGDMDGDGTTDIVTIRAGSQTYSTIEVNKGSGTGTLGAGSLYREPSFMPFVLQHYDASVLLADVDGDGKPDLVMAPKVESVVSSAVNDHCIAIVRGDGSGGFEQSVLSPLADSPTRSVAADFNRDGMPDLAFADLGPYVYTVLGDGAGAFTYSGFQGMPSPVTSMTAGDFDLDGKADLITSDGVNGLQFLAGTGDGDFQLAANLPGLSAEPYLTYPRSMADVNRDGLPDLVVSTLQGQVVVIQSNPGPFYTESQTVIDLGVPADDLVLGDWNRDGYLDLAVVAPNAGLYVVFGSSSGSIDSGGTLVSPGSFTAVCAGDFNRDGIPDLAMRQSSDSGPAGEGILVYLGDGLGGFTLASSLSTLEGHGYSIEAADVNHDGRLDLVTEGVFSSPSEDLPADTEAEVYLGDGNGTFDVIPWADGLIGTMNSQYIPPAMAPFPYGPFTVADVDGDTTPDVIAPVVAGSDVEISTLHINAASRGNGLLPVNFYASVSDPRRIAVGDLNRDGKPDVATCTLDGAPGVAVHLGNGDGTLGAKQVLSQSWYADQVAIADFNRDGIPDIAASNSAYGAPRIATMLGTGDGINYSAPNNYFAPVGLDFQVGDMDRDGIPDIVAAIQDSVRVLLGVGDGTFTGGSGVPLSPCYRVKLADLNRDGYLDVVCASGSVTVIYGGPSGLQPPVTVPGPFTTCQTVCVADFNRDGFLDIEANDSNHWYILWGAAVSPFSTSAMSTLAFEPFDVVEGDAEANGVPYLYAVHNLDRVEVLSVSPTGAIASTGSYTVMSQPSALALGDLNRDGGLDVVAISSADSTIAVNLHGTELVTAVEPSAVAPRPHATLFQNYPNPFNPMTTIRYTMPGPGRAELLVYDVRGRRVATLEDGPVTGGDHTLRWDGRDSAGRPVASGVYFYRLSTASGHHESRRMVLMK